MDQSIKDFGDDTVVQQFGEDRMSDLGDAAKGRRLGDDEGTSSFGTGGRYPFARRSECRFETIADAGLEASRDVMTALTLVLTVRKLPDEVSPETLAEQESLVLRLLSEENAGADRTLIRLLRDAGGVPAVYPSG